MNRRTRRAIRSTSRIIGDGCEPESSVACADRAGPIYLSPRRSAIRQGRPHRRRICKNQKGQTRGHAGTELREHYALLWDLLSTAPATLRGAIAVLAYIRESQGLRETVYGEDDTSAALGHSMERYLCLLVGLPAPPTSEHMTQIMEEMAECA